MDRSIYVLADRAVGEKMDSSKALLTDQGVDSYRPPARQKEAMHSSQSGCEVQAAFAEVSLTRYIAD
jgi:hypothetical protein